MWGLDVGPCPTKPRPLGRESFLGPGERGFRSPRGEGTPRKQRNEKGFSFQRSPAPIRRPD